MASAIIDLLKRTLSVGGSEVRLIPGRRVVIAMPQGDSEVRGDPQTSERIQALVDPVATKEARLSLASGYAEWEFPLEDKGPVRVRAEVKGGQLSVSFFLDRCDANGQPALPRAPASSASGAESTNLLAAERVPTSYGLIGGTASPSRQSSATGLAHSVACP